MTTSDWVLRLPVIAMLGLLGVGYWRGWRQLRRADRGLASPQRLLAFALSMLLFLLTLLPPLELFSRHFLLGRTVQKIVLAFWAAPLFWLACPFHIIVLGLPFAWRRRLTHWLRPRHWLGRGLRLLTQPAFNWLLFVSAIVLWHDAAVVDWTMPRPAMHLVALLVLGGVALLYWSHLVGTEPRLRRQLPAWVLFAYVVGVEIPNMATGMTIAYGRSAFYAYYAAQHNLVASGLGVIEDQMVSGGLIWFMGSFVFFASAVLVLHRMFRHNKENSAQHFPDWDSDERMIAPGLEHRLKEKRLP